MGKISKEDGFKAPKDYFKGLTDDILDQLDKEASDIPKTGGFKVPEGYFDTLNDEILSKTAERETKVVKLFPYKKLLYTAVSAAAIVLIFIGLQWQGDQSLTFDDLANIELEEYIENYATGINTYEIAEVFAMEELDAIDILENEWDEDNIVDYLDESIDDLDDLGDIDDLDELNLISDE